jgi:glycosyltransferase involved in cell wall biosynthesis
VLRVLVIDLERAWRGGQSQALLLLQGLRSLGHEAELLSVRGSALAERAEAAGVPVHMAPTANRRLGAAFRIRRLLQTKRFDVVHANEPHALTAAWMAGASHHVSLVAARRVAYPISHSPVARARYRAARRIIAISEFVARSVTASGLAASAIRVVYDGVPVPPDCTNESRRDARERWGVTGEEPLIGCVGYLLPEKGQEFLLRALPAIRSRFASCRLLFVGDGPERLRLEHVANEIGMRTAVLFAGHVKNLDEVYSALDVFVFPSLAEPLGSSLVAAMAAGLPVVGVASGAVPEAVEAGVSGLLVTRPDANEIAISVKHLLEEPELAERLGLQARKVVCDRFTADRMVAETVRVYNEFSSTV